MSKTPSTRRGLLGAVSLVAVTAACALPTPAAAGVALSTSGWEWSDPAPQGYTLTDVQFAGARGYAVGAGGTALRSDDGGATWAGLFTGTAASINSLDVIDANTIAVATGTDANCSLRLSRDAGATFTLIPVGDSELRCPSSSFSAFDFVSAQQGYVMRSGGAVLATADGGASFGSRSTVDGGASLRFVDGQIGYAVGKGTIYRTTDGAQTWNPIYSANAPLTQIRVIDAQHLIAWGRDRLVRSVDGGATWLPGTIAGEPSRVSWSDASHLAFVSDAKLLLSDDGGATVREVTLGNKDLTAAAYVDTGRIVAVGNGGVTYVSSDGGANFSRLSTDRVGASLGAILPSAGGPVGIGDGRIGRVVAGRWQLLSTLSSARVLDADFSSPVRGYVLRSGNTLLRTINNGSTWSQVDPGTTNRVDEVLTPNDATTLLFGRAGVLRATNGGAFAAVGDRLAAKLQPAGAEHLGARVVAWDRRRKMHPLISIDGGSKWRAITLPKGAGAISSLRPLPKRGLLLVAAGRTYRSTTDTGRWSELSSLGVAARDVTAATANEYFAAGGSSWPVPVVLHSTDAGRTWQPQAVGADGTSVTSLVAGGPGTAYALSGGGGPFTDAIFSTSSGGSRGTIAKLSLDRTKSTLRRSGGRIQLAGQLAGGRGGEQVRVALRRAGSAVWDDAAVIVGANGGGSFTASFKARKGRYVAVAQWAGDSGRAGSGTSAKTLTVK